MHTVMKKARPTWELAIESWPVKNVDIPLGSPWLDTHKPDSWHQFCTMTQAKYELRGEPVAAMIYWSMRYWDAESEVTVEHPRWWNATCEYWDYKASWMENRL